MAFRPSIGIGTSVAAVIVTNAINWYQGFAVDVTFPGGVFMPFLVLPMALIPTAILVVAFTRVIRRVTPLRQRMGLLVGATVVVVAQFQLPSLKMRGFQAKMSDFPESEYLELAQAIRTLDETGAASTIRFGADFVEALQEDHRLLRVSSWYPKVFVNSELVEIHWGSGLTGGLAVEIWRSDTGKPGWGDYLATSEVLYPHVQLLITT